MTRPIKLSFGNEIGETTVSNIFIDEYMADANGAYVKVYLYLLRCLGDSSVSVSVAAISEKLDETEKDIIKALRYWEKQKLLHILWDAEGQISSITLDPLTGSSSSRRPDNIITLSVADSREEAPAPVKTDIPRIRPVKETAPEITPKPDYTTRQIAKFKQHDDFNELIDFIEERLGCTMKLADLQTPAFLYEQLEMPAPLIRYLYEYCIFKGKTAPAYIEKVAMSWHDKNIDTVDRAKAEVFSRSKDCAAIKEAFGISRSFGAIELDMINRWKFTYNMSTEMIREACNRTLLNTGSPDFKYADGILSGWYKRGVTDMNGIAAADAEHAAKAQKSGRTGTARGTSDTSSSNKFNQFPQRSYSDRDYEDLERRKLGKL